MCNKISNYVSIVFSPFLVPTYAIIMVLWLSILFVVPLSAKLAVTGVTFGLTSVIPFLLVLGLYRVNSVKNLELTDRTERLIPYVVSVICYSALALYYHSVHSPIWLTLFAVGGGLSVIVTLVVNQWWKISAHATAMGGLAMFVYILYRYQLFIFGGMPMFYAAVILAGIVGTARIVFGHHTPMQVLAGTANGALCIYLTTLFY